MAFTIGNISTPNTQVLEGELLGMKARMVDLTFDSSYDNTNGEVLNASELGWSQILGFVIVRQPYDATAKLSLLAEAIPNASQTAVAVRTQRYDGSSAGVASFQDTANAVNLSTYTMRVIVIGL